MASIKDKEKTSMPSIYQSYAAILKYGTPTQKKIIMDMQGSLIHIFLASLGGASGVTDLDNRDSTQRLIDTQFMDVGRAYSEIRLRIDPVTAQTNAGLEGTLVHESRHAQHIARVISEFSSGKKNPYNPTRFEVEYAAHKAYVEYVNQAIKLNHPDKNVFVNEAVSSLGIATQVGNRLVMNEVGIRNRLLSNPYNVSDKTRGKMGQTVGDFLQLLPKNGW